MVTPWYSKEENEQELWVLWRKKTYILQSWRKTVSINMKFRGDVSF